MQFSRNLQAWALSEAHLNGRMSFVAGPRQIGKTTIVQKFLTANGCDKNYFNWDTTTIRRKFAENPLFFIEGLNLSKKSKQWVAFDEIHKYPNWKNILKGYFDEFRHEINFSVTGSARLDLFRKAGDSLVGRYFLFKMFPLTPREVNGEALDIENIWHPSLPIDSMPDESALYYEAVSLLLKFGGFPEPFAASREEFTTRWRENHVSLLVDEELRDLSRIGQLKKVETLIFLMPERIGSPLSLNALKGPLECAHATIKSWLEGLNKVFVTFSLKPWTAKLSRSVLKEEKFYFWDWGLAAKTGSVFENFIAVSLSNAVSVWNEFGLGQYALYYVRTKDGLEVDFLISNKREPLVLIECRESDDAFSPVIEEMKNKLHARTGFQVVNKKGLLRRVTKDTFVIGVDRFMQLLP